MTSHARSAAWPSRGFKAVPRGSSTDAPSTGFPLHVLPRDCHRPPGQGLFCNRDSRPWHQEQTSPDNQHDPELPSYLTVLLLFLIKPEKVPPTRSRLGNAPDPNSKTPIGRTEDANFGKQAVAISRPLPLPPLLEVPEAATKTKLTCRARGSWGVKAQGHQLYLCEEEIWDLATSPARGE